MCSTVPFVLIGLVSVYISVCECGYVCLGNVLMTSSRNCSETSPLCTMSKEKHTHRLTLLFLLRLVYSCVFPKPDPHLIHILYLFTQQLE